MCSCERNIELEIYKDFYNQVLNRPKNTHCGAKIDYIKARILDVQEKLSLLPSNGTVSTCTVKIDCK